jgi:hypothetical protein
MLSYTFEQNAIFEYFKKKIKSAKQESIITEKHKEECKKMKK